MNFGVYGILIIFGIFVVLLIINPNMSCFGKRVSSPLYPLLRKKKQRKIKTEDYGFHLNDEEKLKDARKTQEEDDG
jgi:hypothetical protein